MSFPATFNISYYKGDKYEFIIRPKNSDGSPFQIESTTHTAYFYISTARGANASLTEAGVAIIEGNNIVVTITPTLGNRLDPGKTYVYDVSVQKDAGEIYTLLTGNISVTGDITGPGS